MTERRDVIRTRQLIENAYYELLFKKSDGRITVKDVLNEANISRGTFYAHYKDIPDLAEKVEASMLCALKEALSSATLEGAIEDPKELIRMALQMITTHKSELRILLAENENPQIMLILKQLLFQVLSGMRLTRSKPGKAAVIDAAIAGLVFDSCRAWLLSDTPVSEDAFVDILSAFLSGGLTRLFPQS